MADVVKLEQLVHTKAQPGQNTRMVESEAKMADENVKLIAVLAANPAQQPLPHVQQPDAAAIRSDKFSKLALALRKSGKVKDFKEGQDSSVEDWLKRFDQEVLQLKKMSGIADDLTHAEYIEYIRDKLHESGDQR